MGRRRSSSAYLWADGRVLAEIPPDEQKVLKAAELGDLGTLRSLLENLDETTASRLVNARDIKDRTVLEISTENEHLEIVEFLVDNHAPMLAYAPVHECIMLAISKGYVRITQVLLRHPMYQRNRGTLNRLGTITNYYEEENTSKFDQDVTPLMLAAHFNEVDLIRIFLERGEVIKAPHVPSCDCHYCRNRRKFDPLKHSKSALFAYRALASPAYISLTSSDPILTAFLLSQELTQLAKSEKEFKNEYRELVQQCKTYTSDLLDMCQNSREVSLILNQEDTTMDEELSSVRSMTTGAGGSRRQSDNSVDYQGSTLQRLKLALLYEQKQFVSHPHCQHHLATIWYDSIPAWRRIPSIPLKMILPLLMYVTTPVWGVIFWCAPKSWIGRTVSAPLAKFATQSVAYLFFVLALFLHSVMSETGVIFHPACPEDAMIRTHTAGNTAESNACDILFARNVNETTCCLYKFRGAGIHGLDIFIFVYLVGMFWGEVKQMWAEGFKLYFVSGWNCIDVCMLSLYFGAFLSKAYSDFRSHRAQEYMLKHDNFCLDARQAMQDTGGNEVILGHLYFLLPNRRDWNRFDPIFFNEALFATANVLSFSRLSYILPISEFLGPLQISLGRMLGDIIRFGVVFLVVFLAFFCSFLNLYWHFEDASPFGTFVSTLLTLFWSLFGMAESSETNVPEQYLSDSNDFALTSALGTTLFVMYHLVMNLVMLNMLIAMMSNSFQEIEADQDVEWKFARAKLWMSYFEKGATLPIPFNVIPSPKSFYRIYQWVMKRINKILCGNSHLHSRRENIHLAQRRNRNKKIHIVSNSDMLRIESTHQSTMKAIVKRYLFKLQRAKDADEVNEGELEEIKNDISSLRFELLELLTSGGKEPTKGKTPGGGGGDAKQAKQWRRPVVNGKTTRTSGPEPPDRLDELDRKVAKVGDELAQMKREILAAINPERKAVRFSLDNDDVTIDEKVEI